MFKQTQSGNDLTIILSNSKLAGMPLAIAAPGASVALTTMYSIADCICPNCIDQIEVGMAPGVRAGCVYDANPTMASCMTPTTGMATFPIIAPTTPGAYEIRFNLGQAFACGTTPNWFAQAPSAATTVAVLCVR